MNNVVTTLAPSIFDWIFFILAAGMRKFRIDQDLLIEHWHMIYIMSVVFAIIYV